MSDVRWLPGPEKIEPEELTGMLKEVQENGDQWARFILYCDRLKTTILILISFN